MCIENVIDFIFPHMTGEKPKDKWKDITPDKIEGNCETDKFKIAVLERLADEEEARSRQIDTKASVLLGIVGGVVALTTGFLNRHQENSISLILVIVYCMYFIYFLAFIYNVTKTLHRRAYRKVLVDNVYKSTFSEKQYICQLTNNIRHNYYTINRKVDSMTLAEMHFTRVIVMLILASTLELIFEYIGPSNIISIVIDKLCNVVDFLSIPGYLLAFCFILSLIAFVCSIKSISVLLSRRLL